MLKPLCLASVSCQDCRPLAWVLWVGDKVIPEALSQTDADVLPCSIPFSLFSAAPTTDSVRSRLSGSPRPPHPSAQHSDLLHLHKPIDMGVLPLPMEAGVPPVKSVPENPLLRYCPHRGAACTSSDGLVARRPCPVKNPEGWLPPRPTLLCYLLEPWPASDQKPFRKLENCFQA